MKILIVKYIRMIIPALLSLCSGCGSSSSSSAKIDAISQDIAALSQKIDVMGRSQMVVWSNQVALWNEMEATKAQIQGINIFDYGLATNLFSDLASQEDSINRYCDKTAFISLSNGLVLASAKIQIDQIQGDLFSANEKLNNLTKAMAILSSPDENLLRAEMTIGDLDDDVGQMKLNIDQIKSKLGIIY